MGLLDNLQKAAKDMAPIAKELATEAGRTAKAVGETVKEEHLVKKAAAGAGKAIKSASNSVKHEQQVRQKEKEIDDYAELKAKYPGKTLMFARRYYSHQFIKNEKTGIKDIAAFRGFDSGLSFFDEYMKPLYLASGDFTDKRCRFRLIDTHGNKLGEVIDLGIIKRKPAIFMDGRHISDFSAGSFSNSSFQMQNVNGKTVVYYNGDPLFERTSEKRFDLLLVSAPSHLAISALIYTAFEIISNISNYTGGGGE